MSHMKRREFITAVTSGLFGLGVSGKPQESIPVKIKKYNVLGKTGIKVPDVSFGAISMYDSNVPRYAYECGVTYFDTAEGYLRMKGEAYVGQGLKGVRDKVIITTKPGQT